MARIYMENEGGDKIRICERRTGDNLMTVIRGGDGSRKDFEVQKPTRELVARLRQEGFKVTEMIE
jgi:hypothetical protein